MAIQKNSKNKTAKLVMLGLLIAIMLVLSYTPLGYLKLGIVEITFNMIPVAIAAIILGPVGGGIIGGVFGLTSFFQCIGIGGLSPFGAALFAINPAFTFILCFIPRVLVGVLVGFIYRLTAKLVKAKTVSCAIAGFMAAFLNTATFMISLVVLFGSSDYISGMMAGQNIILFICAFVGFNALFEMLASTVITSAVGAPLIKAKIFSDK